MVSKALGLVTWRFAHATYSSTGRDTYVADFLLRMGLESQKATMRFYRDEDNPNRKVQVNAGRCRIVTKGKA